MESLIYVSVAAPSVTGGDVFDIIRKSSDRNTTRGITGFLVFADGLFFQYVEGAADALDQLLADLSRDRRHHSIRILDRRPCAARIFPDWRMKRLLATEQPLMPATLITQMRGVGMPFDAVRAVEAYLAARVV